MKQVFGISLLKFDETLTSCFLYIISTISCNDRMIKMIFPTSSDLAHYHYI